MPRKTKEENEKKKTTTTKKATTTSKKTAASTKKATSTKKVASKKAATTAKKSTTKAKTTTAKKSTTKKTTAKKTTASKTSTSKKKVTTKKPTKKEATTRKRTIKADDLLDETLEVSEYYDLPFKYNKTVVKTLAQTPTTLFVYWEISDEDVEKYKGQYGENFFEVTKPVLIIRNETLNYSFEVEINDYANCWYLRINNSKCDYKVELGRRPIEYSENIEDYIYITSSNDIESPNDHILLERFPELLEFRNVKNGERLFKKFSALTLSNIEKIYSIYDLYKLIYEDEDLEEITNPSSGGNPSSGSLPSSGSMWQ